MENGMKLLITGARGQLGSELTRLLQLDSAQWNNLPFPAPAEALLRAERICVDMDELDVQDRAAVAAWVSVEKPDIIINCAAYTNVDGCEENRDLAFEANSLGARNLAIAAEQVGAKLVHLSTDYVFSGTEPVPRSEWDLCMPQSVYGYTKLMGENYIREFCSRHFIVRTAWLYGYIGSNFVKTILHVGREKGKLSVVDDQRGNPTNATDLAAHLLQLCTTEEYGIYHCSGTGECSWYDFAEEIIRLSGLSCSVRPTTSETIARPAKRPAYSSLENRMLRCTVGDNMREWKDAISDFMMHYNKENGEITI